MRTVLKIHGTPVLNFWELQQRFSLMELYKQPEIFADFAEIHCVPIPVILKNEKSKEKYVAQEFTKAFWYNILRSASAEKDYDASEAFRNLVQETPGEAGDAQVLRKLDFICRKIEKKDEDKEALVLLAICELSEVDPRKIGWEPEKKEENHAGGLTDSGSKKVSSEQITYFPYERIARPTTGAVYRYWYHDAEKLQDGAAIQTVKVMASGGMNRYAAARIELYREKTGQCIYTLELKEGEYKYCTVSQGRIIEFLPDISLSDDLCMVRPDFRSSTVKVVPKSGEFWMIDAENVSCFSVGGADQGFLMVQKGRVNYQFYKNAANYNTKLQLEMIIIPVVGIKVTEKGFEILLEDGTVVSNQVQKRRTQEISLNPRNRFPYPQIDTSAGYRETAVSDSGRSSAELVKDKESEVIRFG